MRTASLGQISPARNATESGPLKQPKGKGQSARGQPAEFSEGVYLFKVISQALEQTPEVRGERVEVVKKKLGNGRYQLDTRHMARLILEAIEDSRGSYRVAA
jgi:anti-sigma28 factor (negative regulator of flagellin synthesis)